MGGKMKDKTVNSKVEEFQEMMNDAEACAYLGFKNKVSLRNMRSKGRGPKYVKLGNYVRYRKRDLDKWIDEQIVDPAA